MTVEPNAAVTAADTCWQHCVAGDFSAAGELMRADFLHDDRRAGMANTISDRERTLEGNRAACDLGFVPSFEPLAVDGDHRALCRVVFKNEDGYEVEALQVLANDSSGFRMRCISFDPDDVDAARAEFEAAAS